MRSPKKLMMVVSDHRSTQQGKKIPASSTPRSAPGSPRCLNLPNSRLNLSLCLALVVAALAAYAPVVHNDFVDFDDHQYITENSRIKSGFTWESVSWAFTTYNQSNWHPLTWLSLILDYDLFGLNAAGYHCTSVALHAASAVLLFLFLQSATGFRWRSLMVAALFALHPINVESVAWAVERKNTLSMVFFALALCAYVWYARKPGVARYSAMAFAFLLALLAKPQVITFPLLLLLLDYWPLRRLPDFGHPETPTKNKPRLDGTAVRDFPKLPFTHLLLEKVPLLLLSMASAVITVIAQKRGGAVQDFAHYSLLVRLENTVVAYVRYLGKAFWPAHLVAMYPHPAKPYPVWQVLAAAALLALISALTLRQCGRRYLVVGWLWFLGSLVPMIGLVQVGDQAMADRYAYIPFIGLFMAVVWLISDFAEARKIPPLWLPFSTAACLLVLGILSFRQVRYWHDTESFWERTVALTQNNYTAHKALAIYFHQQGRDDDARRQAREELASRPGDPAANLLLGDYEQSRGNFAAALDHYRAVALGNPEPDMQAKGYAYMALAYHRMGKFKEARENIETSLQLDPNQASVFRELAAIEQNQGDLKSAIRDYGKANALHPTAIGYVLLARAFQLDGRLEEAGAMIQQASKMTPNLQDTERRAAAFLAGK